MKTRPVTLVLMFVFCGTVAATAQEPAGEALFEERCAMCHTPPGAARAPTLEILRERRARVVTVTEEAIVDAARFHLERMKLVVEPSGAVGLAVLREIFPEIHGMKVGVVISGGNTDFAWLRG